MNRDRDRACFVLETCEFGSERNVSVPRRLFLGMAASMFAAPCVCSTANAQAYPPGVVRSVVGSTAGPSGDSAEISRQSGMPSRSTISE